MSTRRSLHAVAGASGIVFGIFGAIPSFIQGSALAAVGSALFVSFDIIMLALAFGD